MSITLPNHMAHAVKAKVRIGDYGNESEVIREGLRARMARECAVKSWLHELVGSAYDAIHAVPSRGLSADQACTSGHPDQQASVTHRIVFSPEALQQLSELFDYIAHRASPAIAMGCADNSVPH